MTLREIEHLEFAEDGCDACHMPGRRSRFHVFLEGFPYNKENHEPLESEDEIDMAQKKAKEKARRRRRSSPVSSAEDSGDSEDSEDGKLPREFLMGKFCKRRAEVFHNMSHWGGP